MTKFGIRAQGDSVERSERRYNTTTRRCPRDQKRNRKLICMTSSVERLEQMWVVLSEYATYLNQLWYIAQETQNHHCGTCHIHLSWKSKIAAAAILKCRKTSISPRQTIATTSARWLSPYMESRALATTRTFRFVCHTFVCGQVFWCKLIIHKYKVLFPVKGMQISVLLRFIRFLLCVNII